MDLIKRLMRCVLLNYKSTSSGTRKAFFSAVLLDSNKI